MKLLKHVRTYENLQLLVTELDSVNLSLSGDTTGDLVSLITKDSPTFAEPLIIYLKEKDIKSKKGATSLLAELSKNLKTVEPVELTLAFTPSEDITNKIFDWAIENVSPNIVLKYKKNPSIMSGALISYKGKYGDFSGAKHLKEAFVAFRKGMKI